MPTVPISTLADKWRFQCPERHDKWQFNGDAIYCTRCVSAFDEVWDKKRKRTRPVSELEDERNTNSGTA